MRPWFALPAVALLLAACAMVPDPAPVAQIAPTGKLRVGIGVGAVPSAFWATADPATGKPRGVTVDLGVEFARRLGVPLQLVTYNNSGEVTAGGPNGEWDVAFMPVDAERMKMVDFGPAYLAGAMGKPVWILLPFNPRDWRWMLGREDSAWYPTARLFRQPAAGDWASVMRRVDAELSMRFGAQG